MKFQLLIFLLLGSIAICLAPISAQTLDKKFASTNGTVNAIAVQGDTAYIGGGFNQVGIGAKGLAAFSPGSAKPDVKFPEIGYGYTYCSEPDGMGGFYLGGFFSNFNGVEISPTSIIHVLSDQTLDPAFGPVTDADFGVYALKKTGNTLYVGGNFSAIQETLRPYLVSLNATTGELTSWVPDPPNYAVRKIEADDQKVFITGDFSRVGGFDQPNAFAALSASTGQVILNFPRGNSTTTSIKLHDNKLYQAGYFNELANYTQGLAKVNTTDGSVDPSFAFTNGSTYAILSDGSGGYYIGGSFSHIGNKDRSYLAHILSSGEVDPAFNVTLDGYIYCLATDGTNLYLGGGFTVVNGSTRNYGAAVLLETGVLTNFNPNANSNIYSMAHVSGTIYMGGSFTTMKGSSRNYGAAVTTTNALTNWSPNTNSYIQKVVPNTTGTSIFIAGDFSTVKGANFPYVAKVNANNGNPSSWKPQPNAQVYELVLSGSTVYVGGYFSSINGFSRQYFAAIDTTSNSPTSLIANTDSYIHDLNINGGKLYVAGDFSIIQDVSRKKVARIDLANGTIDSWNGANPINPNYTVQAILGDGGSVVIGGDFSFLKSVARNHIAVIDLTTPAYNVTDFNPSALYLSGAPNAMAIQGNELFVAGNMSYLDNENNYQYNLLVADATTGNTTRSFNSYPNSPPISLAIQNNRLVIGGSFSSVYFTGSDSVAPRSNMASYDLTTNQLSTDVYDPDNSITSILLEPGSNKLIVTGNFYLMNVVNRSNLAAINLNSGSPTDWMPNVNGTVYSLAVDGKTVFAGGSFTAVNITGTQVSRYYIAAFNNQTGIATSWQANADSWVHALATKNGILYAGGRFTTIKGAARNYGAALSTTTGAVQSWAPNTNNFILTIAPLSNSIYIGGNFTTVKGSPRNFLARCNTSNGSPTSWNPSPDSYINDMAVFGSKLLVGGSFYNISAQARHGLAVFDTATNALSPFDAKLNPDTYLYVNAVEPINKDIALGGQFFSMVDTESRGNLASVDTATAAATNFNPMPNTAVNTLVATKTKLLAGGDWSSLGNDISPSYFAVFNLSPTVAASSLNFTNIQPTGVTANWTNGDGEKRLLVVKEGSMPASPHDGRSYNDDAAFGSGSSIDDNSFVCYNGTGSSVSISNLLPNHAYYFAVFEYNGSGTGAEYLQTPYLSGTITTPCPVQEFKISPEGPLMVCASNTETLTAPAGFSSYSWTTGATTQQISVGQGDYGVLLTDQNGCVYSTPQVHIGAKPPLTPTINPAGPIAICNGETVQLSVDNDSYSYYQWSNGATTPSITIGTAGSYNVTVTNAEGCTGTSNNVIVSLKPTATVPEISASPNPTKNLCPGTVVTLTSSTNTRNMWSTGETTKSIIVNTAGAYTVKFTNNSGCSSTSKEKTVTYRGCGKVTAKPASNITTSSATVGWKNLECAKEYTLIYRKTGTKDYTTIEHIVGLSYNITGLIASTQYEWKVRGVCQTEPVVQTSFTDLSYFTTMSPSARGNEIVLSETSGFDASVYPNPTTSSVVLRVSANNLAKTVYSLKDVSGRLIVKNMVRNTVTNLALKNLAAGVYLIEVTNGNETKVLRLVKE